MSLRLDPTDEKIKSKPSWASVFPRPVKRITAQPTSSENLQPEHTMVALRNRGPMQNRAQIRTTELVQIIMNPTANAQAFCHWLLISNTILLTGGGRISLVNDQPGGDLQAPPQNSLQVLFRDQAKRDEVRRIVHEAFSVYFVIDPTHLGQLRIRLSNREPADRLEEIGIHPEAADFHSHAVPIAVASDGVKAFTGIIVEVIAGDPSVLLIDEPEAFLHPSLASKMGLELSRAARSTDKRVFVSTHSPDFVMGCIQSGAPVNIVRLTYRAGVATARILPSADILKMMRHPLLRSTSLLRGIFYEFVIVTESDADRAFYQEVNERLLQFRPGWGIPNCLFINAQNKQTVQTIIQPLRRLGIPAASVVDVDVFKCKGPEWSKLLSSANVPSLLHNSLASTRAALERAMLESGRCMKRDGGINILSLEDREAAENLVSQLAQYGIFVVPGGELESWLKHLGATSHGPNWLVQMFEKMGEDPDRPEFVRPTENDVWHFLATIRTWLVDPNRKGIPS